MQTLLTREQVQDVIDFAEGIYIAENGIYSPWLSNEVLQNLNNNPRIPDSDKIKDALSKYKSNSENIKGYMDFMSHFDMIFERTLQAYVNVLALDLEYFPTNAYTQSDWQSEQLKKDMQTVDNFLTKFDYKTEFRNVLKQVMKNETYYTWFRRQKWGNKGMKYALQVMPQDYCMLTGYWEKGLLWDFDLSYFFQPGVDINGYDQVFKEYLKNALDGKGDITDYIPTNQFNDRRGTYALWTQTSPTDGSWAWKFSPRDFSQTPYLAPLLKEAISNEEVAELQKDKDIAAAYGILAGEIQLFDNAKSGTTKNQFAIDPKTLGTFMGKAKRGLGNNVKLAAMPVKNVDFYQYEDKNPSSYDEQLRTTAGVGSGISRVIYSSDRMSNAELQFAVEELYHTMEPMYAQFSNFLEFYVNQMTKKYKFAFRFSGCSYQFDRQDRFDRLCKAADKGIVLGPSAWGAAMGYKPQDFNRLLEQGHYSDFTDKLTLLLNANTMKDGSDNKGGREKIDDTILTDSGERTRNS
nr:MAG TPA: portal protein [Caudoviricetes sp.]